MAKKSTRRLISIRNGTSYTKSNKVRKSAQLLDDPVNLKTQNNCLYSLVLLSSTRAFSTLRHFARAIKKKV